MRKSLFLLLLVIAAPAALALDAVVTVLESPMLREASLEAKAVQYLRKGDVIKVHPSFKATQEDIPEFIPTQDRQGNVVYVIASHLYFYFETPREFTQSTLKKDPTDYRLDEPLLKGYPLIQPTGYRGQFVFGITQPYNESYGYSSKARAKGYSSPVDVNVNLLKKVPDDKQDRYYFGGTLNVRYFQNEFVLANGRESNERGLKLGLGPYISYDAFKGVRSRVNVHGSITVNLLNQIIVSQEDATEFDSRIYRGISLSPRIGAQWVWMDVLEDVDFLVGTSIDVEPATTYHATTSASEPSWWRASADDKFTTRTTFTLAGFVGVQSSY